MPGMLKAPTIPEPRTKTLDTNTDTSHLEIPHWLLGQQLKDGGFPKLGVPVGRSL